MRIINYGERSLDLCEFVGTVIEFDSRITETPIQLRYHGRGRWYARLKDTPDRALLLDANLAVPATAFVKSHPSFQLEELNPIVYLVDVELAQEAIITYAEHE